jgi:hypothetical protein
VHLRVDDLHGISSQSGLDRRDKSFKMAAPKATMHERRPGDNPIEGLQIGIA